MRTVRMHVLVFLPLFALATVSSFADETPAGYRATEDVVFGHKDGLALTLDVLEPEQNLKRRGLILVSSGSWMSRKSDVVDEEEHRRQHDHWTQGRETWTSIPPFGNGLTII